MQKIDGSLTLVEYLEVLRKRVVRIGGRQGYGYRHDDELDEYEFAECEKNLKSLVSELEMLEPKVRNYFGWFYPGRYQPMSEELDRCLESARREAPSMEEAADEWFLVLEAMLGMVYQAERRDFDTEE